MKRTPLKRKTRLKGQSSLKRTRLKRVSPERAKRERAKHKTYEKIDAEWSGLCDGCGKRVWPINNSHLLPESKFPQFAANKQNLRKHCQEHCHRLWEGGLKGVKDMLDYEENMKVVKELDYNYYLKLRAKHNRNE